MVINRKNFYTTFVIQPSTTLTKKFTEVTIPEYNYSVTHVKSLKWSDSHRMSASFLEETIWKEGCLRKVSTSFMSVYTL